ncbi:MAG TPA: magnesium transporter [Candidatus Saccharimonadales bacterium]
MTVDSDETIKKLLTTNVPTCRKTDTLSDIIHAVASDAWDSVHHIYVLDDSKKLLGAINLAQLEQPDHSVTAQSVMKKLTVTLEPDDDQEKAVFLAVKQDVTAIPVVDKDNTFYGAITAREIIQIMHNEHIEDALLTAGVRGRGSSIVKLAVERTSLVVGSRAPWLFFGLIAGLGLGLISSWFETELKETVALAYFIPVVAYIADSVGTQSEAIAVRALATLKVNYINYLLKELLVGAILGVGLGIIGGLGATLISQSPQIGLVVALSLAIASTVAAVMATSIPILFKKFGKDPAIASGPLATALQDLVSVAVYFALAMLLL